MRLLLYAIKHAEESQTMFLYIHHAFVCTMLIYHNIVEMLPLRNKESIQDHLAACAVQGEAFKCNYVVLAQERGQVKGALFLRLCEDQSFAIECFCVHPGYRKMGVGTQMIAYVTQEFAHADKKVILTRNEDHDHLKCFFATRGFTEAISDDGVTYMTLGKSVCI